MIVAGFNLPLSTMPQPELAFVPARARAGEVRRERALKALLREGAGMTQQAKALLPVDDDRAAARRVARAPPSGSTMASPRDLERAQLVRACRGAASSSAEHADRSAALAKDFRRDRLEPVSA